MKLDLERNEGLPVHRLFTKQGADVFSMFEWTLVDVSIRNAKGEVIFSQQEVEVPASWSHTAAEILAYKYFRRTGVTQPDGSSGGEKSAKQVFHRMVNCWTKNAVRHNYINAGEAEQSFYDELVYMLISQMAAPNSPQWFNTGLFDSYGISGPSQGHFYVDPEDGDLKQSSSAYERPQPHACFILSVKDDLLNAGGIMDLLCKEARLFKYGSGSGTNFSALRGVNEPLSGGGVSSGLISFLKIGDRAAGAIKSGGTTRRAAKMVCLDADHPDVEDFIRWKMDEEKKASALVDAGYSGDFDGEAYSTVSGQNSNNSVRVGDEFMRAVLNNQEWSLTARTDGRVMKTLSARKLLDSIAEAAWYCGDPGLQFDTTINAWHTCPQGGRIRASNPCSEYMFLDDTACNLASVNLCRFFDHDQQEFKIAEFEHTCRLWTIVLEISVLMAQFPSADVARMSFEYRTLGLGFTNLGALIMRHGIAYDSDEARSLAAVVSALMTGVAYRTSAEMAGVKGPFVRFSDNKESLLKVLMQHFDALKGDVALEDSPEIKYTALNPELCNPALLRKVKDVWEEVFTLGNLYGFRNAQVTAVAPTGTIGLVMDVDTMGIEPEYSLLKQKKLAGGGVLKLTNASVDIALKVLSYSEDVRHDIVKQLIDTGSIYSCKGLKPEHTSVFLTAMGLEGKPGISVWGHLKMLSAVQPFLSGSVSKTINLPAGATVREVAECFISAWKLGLKSVSIYRDGCKSSQPLISGVHPSVQMYETPVCSDCGFRTERIESCFRCPNCGTSVACS